MSDDRYQIQQLIDEAVKTGARAVTLPSGTFTIGKSPLGYWGLDVPAGVTLRGASRMGTILKMAIAESPSQRLIRTVGDDVTIESLTLDGDKAAQTISEQRHGIFATAGARLTVRDVAARNFTGDGFYLYQGVTEATFERVYASDNDRNGITLGGQVAGVLLSASHFTANRAQQVDSEAGAPHVISGVKIIGCTLDGKGRGGYVLTVSGTGRDTPPGRDWSIIGNTINGPIFVVWAEGVVIAGNHGVNPTIKPWAQVYRRARRVTIADNIITQTQATQPYVAAISVQGVSKGDTPDHVIVSCNQVDMRNALGDSHGVSIVGVRSARVEGNTLLGPGKPSGFAGSGVYVRAAIVDEDMRSVAIHGNAIENWGRYGISQWGNGAAKCLSFDAHGNRFDDTSDSATMLAGIALDVDKLGAVKAASARDNRKAGGVATVMVSVPTGMTITNTGEIA